MTQRPIKLKAWDKELGAFVPLLSLSQLETTHPALTIIQFTGVYDANGCEIWEGDILYWQYLDDSVNKLYECWREVVFYKGAFGTFDGDGDLNAFCDLNLMADVVVGTVFENGSMLTKSRTELTSD